MDFKAMLAEARANKNAVTDGAAATSAQPRVNLKTKEMKPSHLYNLLQLPQKDREEKYMFFDLRPRNEYDARHVRGFFCKNETLLQVEVEK